MAGTLVSRSSAASVACQRSTSQRISAARWRAGGAAARRRTPAGSTRGIRATSAGSAPSGATLASAIGVIHSGLGQCRPEVRLDRGRRRAHLHRPGPPLHVALHVDADVGGDAVQPRADAGAALERVGIAPGPQHRLLDGVLGLEARAEHPVAVPRQLPAEGLQLGLDDGGLANGHGLTLYRAFFQATLGIVERTGPARQNSSAHCPIPDPQVFRLLSATVVTFLEARADHTSLHSCRNLRCRRRSRAARRPAANPVIPLPSIAASRNHSSAATAS